MRPQNVLAGLAAGTGVLVGLALARRTPYSFLGKVVIITGGSRGLGLVLARELVHVHGARVALVARTAEALARAADDLNAPGSVITIVGDVRSPSDAEHIVDTVVERFGRVDVLINNAGVIISAPIGSTTNEDFRNSLAVHFWGVLHMSRAALRYLPRPGGRIVNICSIGGRLAIPHLAAYCAGKFAQAGLSSVMAEELRAEGVTVSTVYPGLMRTGSYVNAKFRGKVNDEFRAFALASSLPGISMGAERAARQIIRAVRAGRRQIVIPWTIRQVDRIATLAPNLASALFSGVNAVLPADTGNTTTPPVAGADLPLSAIVQRAVTLGERAGARNNEVTVQ
jgi:NAD(P)-dependent dehydrogenase (short-subunit alcohol dehydrogenase family)